MYQTRTTCSGSDGLHFITCKSELSQVTLWIFKCPCKILPLIGNSVRNSNVIILKKRKTVTTTGSLGRGWLVAYSRAKVPEDEQGGLADLGQITHDTQAQAQLGRRAFLAPSAGSLSPSPLPLHPHPFPSSSPHTQPELAGRDPSRSPGPRHSGESVGRSSPTTLSVRVPQAEPRLLRRCFQLLL